MRKQQQQKKELEKTEVPLLGHWNRTLVLLMFSKKTHDQSLYMHLLPICGFSPYVCMLSVRTRLFMYIYIYVNVLYIYIYTSILA